MSERTCSEPGCGGPEWRDGLCSNDWRRQNEPWRSTYRPKAEPKPKREPKPQVEQPETGEEGDE